MDRALHSYSRATNQKELDSIEGDAPPSMLLMKLKQMEEQKAASDLAGDDGPGAARTGFLASMGLLAKRVLVKGALILGRFGWWAAQAARTLMWGVAKVAIRVLVLPLLKGVLGILSSPIGLPIALAVGGTALGYAVYQRLYGQRKDQDTRKNNEVGWWATQINREPDTQEPITGRVISQYRGPVGIEREEPTVFSGSVATDKEKERAKKILASKRSADVQYAIAEAYRRTGMSQAILSAIAYKESTFNPLAKAPTSSAKGLMQFLNGTWTYAIGKYGARYDVPVNASPYDPVASAVMGAAYLKHDIMPRIKSVVPNPSATDLYLGHFMGPAGGSSWLRKYHANPDRVAYQDFPKAAAANRWVYWTKSGVPRSYAQIYDVFASGLRGIESVVHEEVTGMALPTVGAPDTGTSVDIPDIAKTAPGASSPGAKLGSPVQHTKSSPEFVMYRGMPLAMN